MDFADNQAGSSKRSRSKNWSDREIALLFSEVEKRKNLFSEPKMSEKQRDLIWVEIGHSVTMNSGSGTLRTGSMSKSKHQKLRLEKSKEDEYQSSWSAHHDGGSASSSSYQWKATKSQTSVSPSVAANSSTSIVKPKSYDAGKEFSSPIVIDDDDDEALINENCLIWDQDESQSPMARQPLIDSSGKSLTQTENAVDAYVHMKKTHNNMFDREVRKSPRLKNQQKLQSLGAAVRQSIASTSSPSQSTGRVTKKVSTCKPALSSSARAPPAANKDHAPPPSMQARRLRFVRMHDFSTLLYRLQQLFGELADQLSLDQHVAEEGTEEVHAEDSSSNED